MLRILRRPIYTGHLPLPANAVAWYRAENNADDEGGTYNGTPGAGTGYTTGKSGQAFTFNNNSNQRVLLPSINLGADYRIDLYFKPTGVGTTSSLVILANDFTSASNFGALYWDRANTRLTYFRNSAIVVASPNFIVSGKYYKVSLLYGSSKSKLYVNHLLFATESSTHSETYNNAVGIGYPSTGSDFPLVGDVDELILYNVSTPPVAGLAAWYKGDNDVSDSSGWGWDATAGVGTAYDTDGAGTANSAFKFNGNSNSAVTLPTLPVGNNYTIEFDFYADASGNTGFRDIVGGNWSSGELGELYLNSGKLEYWTGGAKRLQGVTTILATTWYHVKLTYTSSDSKSRLYMNGSLEVTETGTHTETISVSGSQIKLGFANGSGAAALFGRMDNFKIYDSVV